MARPWEYDLAAVMEGLISADKIVVKLLGPVVKIRIDSIPPDLACLPITLVDMESFLNGGAMLQNVDPDSYTSKPRLGPALFRYQTNGINAFVRFL